MALSPRVLRWARRTPAWARVTEALAIAPGGSARQHGMVTAASSSLHEQNRGQQETDPPSKGSWPGDAGSWFPASDRSSGIESSAAGSLKVYIALAL